MARIETYTANLASARGSRGQVGAEIDVNAATAPARALAGVGREIQQAALTVEHIGAIKEQRQKEQELRWATDESTAIKDELIKWQQENHTREDFGEAYRKFADDLLEKRGAGAANSRAKDALKARVMPTIQSDWETALKTGERTRLVNFRNGIVAGATKDGDAFRFRYGLNHTDEARDILSSDIRDNLDTIGVTYGKTMPGEARALSESVVVAGVQSALEVDPVFAKEILDGNSRHVDPQSRTVLLRQIEGASHRIGSLELVKREQARKNALADGLTNQKTVGRPDLSFEKANMEPGAFAKYEHDLNMAFEVQNKTIETKSKVAALNPQLRTAAIVEAGKSASGETGLALNKSLAELNHSLAQEQEADGLAYVTKYNDDVQAAHQAYLKSGRPEDEDYWRTLAWKRMGHAPPPLEPELKATLRPEALARREATAKTYQGFPEAERRYILKGEAVRWADTMTKGGWQERLQAVEQINAKFPDEQKRAVVFKDIEQLSQGKGPDIQRSIVASKLAEVNPSAAQFLLSGNGREVFKALKPDVQKEIDSLLSVGVAGSEPSWSLFALASRGATRDSQDLVNGFKAAAEEMAALNYTGSAPDAVNKALKTLIFDRVALPVMTPSVGGSQGQALLIGRGKIDPKTGKVDASLGLRTDGEIQGIARRIAFFKETIKPGDINIKGEDGRPLFEHVVPGLYRTDVKELAAGSEALLDLYIKQKGQWISDQDSQGATFYLLGESGFSFAPTMKATGKPLRIRYTELPAVQAAPRGPSPTFDERRKYNLDYGPMLKPASDDDPIEALRFR